MPPHPLTEQRTEQIAGCTIPLRWQAARAGSGQSQPQSDIIYQTSSRLLCLLRLLGVLDRHPPKKVCQLYTQKTWVAGTGEVISRSDHARQTPHHLSCSELRRAQNAGPTEESAPLRTTWVPEPERLRPGRCMQPRASLGRFPAEQPRAWAVWAGRVHVRWVGAGLVWLRH